MPTITPEIVVHELAVSLVTKARLLTRMLSEAGVDMPSHAWLSDELETIMDLDEWNPTVMARFAALLILAIAANPTQNPFSH